MAEAKRRAWVTDEFLAWEAAVDGDRVVRLRAASHHDRPAVDGEFRRESHDASQPTVVFEIPSRSTAWTDLHRKLHDCDMTPTIAQYVLVAQDGPRVELRSVGATLGMAEVHEGLGFVPEGSGIAPGAEPS